MLVVLLIYEQTVHQNNRRPLSIITSAMCMLT